LVTVYIVLGVLYESYIPPLTIPSTLPSAGVGAILALLLCRTDLSVIALIGIILLIGIVKKNAIMMIDFALEAERTEGKPPEAAIYEACLLRFRPIMMTTMAALLGGLPLAVGVGVGAELRRPLGITIVGGLLLSQLLTLYTTPVVYTEPREVMLHAGQLDVVGARRDRHFELRPVARPHGILGDRLGRVRSEPARPLEAAARLARGGHDACPHPQRRLRCSPLGRAARADEEAGGLDEVAVGAHLIEDALGHHDPELRLERHRQLDEIERIGGQIVTQRDP